MKQSITDYVNIIRSFAYLKVSNIHGIILDLEHGTLKKSKLSRSMKD